MVLWFNALPERMGQAIYKFFFTDLPFAIGFMIGWVTKAVPLFLIDLEIWFWGSLVKIGQFFTDMFTNTQNGFTNWWNWLMAMIPVWLAQFNLWFWQSVTNIILYFQQMGEKIMARLTALWAWVTAEVSTWPKRFGDFLSSLPGVVWAIFTDAKDKAIQIAKDMYDGVGKWFSGVVQWLKDIVDWGGKAIDKVKEAFKSGGQAGKVEGTRANGGWIDTTGLYLMHQGEYVMSNGMLNGTQKSEITNNNSSAPVINLYATVGGDVDIQKLAYAMAYELRNK
jgi:hypothetical protein